MKTVVGWPKLVAAAVGLGLAGQTVLAIDLDVKSADSIKDAAKSVAADLVSQYPHGSPGDVPGLLPDPYYWWEGGMMFGALIDFWHYTGDSKYNKIVQEALLYQTGRENNYMPANQSMSLMNDDQSTWGLSAMTAAEYSFPSIDDSDPKWEDLAKAVFDTQVRRWDEETCGGGLAWEIFSFDESKIKPSAVNIYLFELSARLARHSAKNETYGEWAEKIWDWSRSVGLLDGYTVYDSVSSEGDCTEISYMQWTATTGALLAGSANMYNATNGDKEWKGRIEGILDEQSVFFEDDIMFEAACEEKDTCNIDQRAYKSMLSRALGVTVNLAPFTKETIMPRIHASAKAAAKGCKAAGKEAECKFSWLPDSSNDHTGIGESMGALQIIQAALTDNLESDSSKESSKEGSSSSSDSDATSDTTTTTTPTPTGSGSKVVVGKQQALFLTAIMMFLSYTI